MKNSRLAVAILFLLPFFVPVQSVAQAGRTHTIISGTINLNSEYEAVLAFTPENSEVKRFTVPLSTTGEFTFEFPLKEAGFLRLIIIPKARNKQLAINFPLWIKPESKSAMYLHYNDSTYLTLDSGKLSGANMALITYSNLRNVKSRKLFFEPPSAGTAKAFLNGYFDSADAYIAKWKVKNQKVINYLNAWAMNDYIQNLMTLERQNRSGRALPKEVYEFAKSPVEIFNKPEAMLFYETNSSVNQFISLKETAGAKNIEPIEALKQRLELVEKLFTSAPLRDNFHYRELQEYLKAVKFTTDAEYEEEYGKFRELIKAVGDSTLRDDLLENFTNMRFTRQGAPMPEVVFKDVNGKEVPLSSFKGNYVYIDLWASWCVPCIAEIPDLRKLEKDYVDKDIVFISISLDEDKNAWRKKMKELGLTGHQLETGNSGFENLMGVQGIPHFILYNPSGKLMMYKAPRPSSAQIRTLFDSL